MSIAEAPTTDEAERPEVPASLLDQPLPRITIQAFCVTPGLATAMKDASADRRMTKAHVSVHMGGIEAAVSHYSEMPTPNLIVVESDDQGESLYKSLESLADVCDPGTKVIVAGSMNDVKLYRELIRQGISEYVVTPSSSIQLIEAFGNLYYDPSTAPMGRIFAFIGARGGVGSSTLAHNVAWHMAEEMNEDTVIMDMDIEFGTLGLDFNKDPTQTVLDALTAPDRVDDVLLERLLVKTGENLRLFTAPAALDQDYEIPEGAFEHVLEMVRHVSPTVVIDLPHMWSSWTKRFLIQADEIVITATPDLASLRNGKNLYDLLVQARPNDPAPRFTLNMTGMQKRPEIAPKEFAEALSAAPEFVIPFEGQLFGEAANNGLMTGQVNAQAKSSVIIGSLAQALIGRERTSKTAKKKFSFDLFKGFKRKKSKPVSKSKEG